MAGGRVMIVTGASSGIGRALAERAARAGYAVLAIGRRADRLAELAAAAAFHGGEIVPLALDLREAGAAERIVGEARSRYGGIDVLVNNAGAVAVGALTAQSDEELLEQFETHVLVPIALVRESLALLRVSRGHIFFLGSGVARVPVAGLGAYPSAKAAVRAIARIVRNELHTDGINVTYVDPGAVDTEFMTRAGMAPAPRSILISPHLVARKIFDAIGSERRVVNAAPWQTALVALAEHFPNLTDALLARAPGLIGGLAFEANEPPQLAPAAFENVPEEAPPPVPPLEAAVTPIARESEPSPLSTPAVAQDAPEPASPPAPPTPFAAALAPHAGRMKKLNLTADFVAGLLVTGATLELGEVALRWAGMPNKNERALTLDVLEALAEANFLAREGPQRYRVIQAADSSA
jgi:short-subunit dehydrogenase